MENERKKCVQQLNNSMQKIFWNRTRKQGKCFAIYKEVNMVFIL